MRRYVFCHVRDASIHVGELLTRLVGGRLRAPVACTAEGFRPDQETGLVSEIPLGSHAPGPRHPRLFLKRALRITRRHGITVENVSPRAFPARGPGTALRHSKGHPHWFAGCGMLVSGNFHEKHDIVSWIFRPSGECAAVGRGRRKIHYDETCAVPGGLCNETYESFKTYRRGPRAACWVTHASKSGWGWPRNTLANA